MRKQEASRLLASPPLCTPLGLGVHGGGDISCMSKQRIRLLLTCSSFVVSVQSHRTGSTWREQQWYEQVGVPLPLCASMGLGVHGGGSGSTSKKRLGLPLHCSPFHNLPSFPCARECTEVAAEEQLTEGITKPEFRTSFILPHMSVQQKDQDLSGLNHPPGTTAAVPTLGWSVPKFSEPILRIGSQGNRTHP